MTRQSDIFTAIAGGYAPNNTGLETFIFDANTGDVESRTLLPGNANNSWIELGAEIDGSRIIYAVEELESSSGRLLTLSYNYETEELTQISDFALTQTAPVCLSLHPDGEWLAVAFYGTGEVQLYGLFENGTISFPTVSFEGDGPIGSTTPENAPPGSFANSGHDAPHAHFVEFTRDGNYVLHTDLARDEIYVWAFNANEGTVSNEPVSRQKVSDGGGARHLAFSQDQEQSYLYVITEESSELYTYSFDNQTGELNQIQSLSALPDGFAGTNYASDLILSPNGNFLLCANRLHNSIGVYAIDQGTGLLSKVQHVPCQGDYPRSLALSPDGNYLYLMNQLSDAITKFTFDETTGTLTFDDSFIASGTPAKLVFL